MSEIYQTQVEQIAHLPGDILLSLARNESVTHEMRKAAVRLMIDNGFPQFKHPELVLLVMEIKVEREAQNEVESIVETAIESEIPMAASFTTKNMQQPEIQELIRNPAQLGSDALAD